MSERKSSLNDQEFGVQQLLRAHTESQREAISALENKAQQNFTIINIIAAIVVALNLGPGGSASIQDLLAGRPLFILILVLYALVAILSIRTLRVSKRATHPMTPNEANAKAWAECDAQSFHKLVVESELLIYGHNKVIVDDKGDMVKWAHRLIIVIIGLIFADALGIVPWLSDLAGI